MRKTKLRPVSKKREAQLPEYNALIRKLREMCGNVSELSGERPDWTSDYKVDPHHLGYSLSDPFEIIMLTRMEHMIEEGQIKGDKKGREYLLWLVKSIRTRQGF